MLPVEHTSRDTDVCRWHEAHGLKFDDMAKREGFEKFDFAELEREIDETDAACQRLAPPVVYSHNDLLSGNVMIYPEVASIL